MLQQHRVEGLGFFSGKEIEPGLIEPYFSKIDCDTCYPSDCLAGDRYDVLCVEESTNNIIELSVCADCYVELCG